MLMENSADMRSSKNSLLSVLMFAAASSRCLGPCSCSERTASPRSVLTHLVFSRAITSMYRAKAQRGADGQMPATFEGQVRQTLENVKSVVEAAASR